MCGIISFISTNNTKKSLWEIFRYAHLQRQRGNSDGFGIIYKDDDQIKVFKCLEKISDIYTKTDVKPENLKKIKKIEKFLKKKKSGFIILHHRNATTGKVGKKNTHPFMVDNEFYVHNGTVDSDVLKRYFSIFNKYTQNTDLDSEFLVRFIKKHGIKNARKIWHSIGVLTRISDEKIHIYKDDSRSLYLYGIDNGYILISEPFPDREFNWLYKFDEGYITLSNKGISGTYTGCFVTEKINKFFDEQKTNPAGVRLKSECCNIETLCFNDSKNNDICLDCFLNNVKIDNDRFRKTFWARKTN